MNVGPFQILVIALVLLVLFGRGRVSDLMGDFGKGVTSFREGLANDEPVSLVAHGDNPQSEPAADADKTAA